MRLISVSVDLDGSTRDDRGRLVARCRIPFAFNATMGVRKILDGGAATREIGGAPVDAGAGTSQGEVIEGPASSTSLDWYGTHMGRSALESMLSQFSRGVDYFPRHHSWTATVEWDGVIGRTFAARIANESVKEPVEGREALVLYVSTRLKMRKELAKELVQCIEDGDQIGQSIGGWFTSIAVTYDEEGWPVDVEVLDVELDHLAAVRAPANPDADRLWLATSRALVEAGGDTRARATSRTKGDEGGVTLEARGRSVVARFSVESSSEAGKGEEEGRSAVARSVDAGELPAVVRETVLAPAVESGEGGAPAPEARESAAQPEVEMTKEEMDALIAGMGAQFRSAVEPLAAKIDNLGAQRSAPAPAPAPAPVDPVAVAEARAVRAEAEARAAVARAEAAERMAAGGAQRSGAHATESPTATDKGQHPELVNGLRGYTAGPRGVDLRSICPKALRAVRRSVDEIQLTPGLVFQTDGMRGVVAFAEAEGTAPNLVDVARSTPSLLSDRPSAARELAWSFSPAARAMESARTAGSEVHGWVDRQDLRDLLGEVIYAGLQDCPAYFRGQAA